MIWWTCCIFIVVASVNAPEWSAASRDARPPQNQAVDQLEAQAEHPDRMQVRPPRNERPEQLYGRQGQVPTHIYNRLHRAYPMRAEQDEAAVQVQAHRPENIDDGNPRADQDEAEAQPRSPSSERSEDLYAREGYLRQKLGPTPREIAKSILRHAYHKHAEGMQRSALFGNIPTEILGRGSFGTVFSGSNPDKCFKCFRTGEDFMMEHGAAYFLVHHFRDRWPKNIVRIEIPQKFAIPLEIEGDMYVGCMAMERLGRDLNCVKEFSLSHANQAFLDIGDALCCLADNGLAHTDIKTQNVLCCRTANDRLKLKLGDIAGVTRTEHCRFNKIRGTAACVSPSMFSNFRQHQNRVPQAIRLVIDSIPERFFPTSHHYLFTEDMWQFGIMLLEMLNCEFREMNNAERYGWWSALAYRINRGYEFDGYILATMIKEAKGQHHVKDTLVQMLQFQPNSRLDFPTLRYHLRRMFIC